MLKKSLHESVVGIFFRF